MCSMHRGRGGEPVRKVKPCYGGSKTDWWSGWRYAYATANAYEHACGNADAYAYSCANANANAYAYANAYVYVARARAHDVVVRHSCVKSVAWCL